jgi:hypothetical protein
MGNALEENYYGGLDVYHCLGEKTRGRDITASDHRVRSLSLACELSGGIST